MKMYSRELFSLVFLREKFENTLEISGKAQRIYFLKNVVTLIAVEQYIDHCNWASGSRVMKVQI